MVRRIGQNLKPTLPSGLYSVSAHGQIPAPPQQQPIALVNGTVHPVSGEPVEAAAIVIDAGKIVEIGTDVEIPSDAIVMDLKGKHVYPGLIESHSNLGLTEIGAVDVTNDTTERGDINPNVRAEVAVNPESEHIPVARANGIALAVAAPRGGLISGRSALMMTDGWTWKEMTFEAPLSMMVNWPSMRLYDDDDEAAKKQRDRIRKRIETLDKAIEDARGYMKAAESPRTDERFQQTDVAHEAMIPVLKGDLPVWISADSLLQIESAVSWADKHKLKVVLVGGSQAWHYTDLLKQRDIPVIITSV
ncbi:MAG: amidohydrolase family protein, partial [Planctomycetota bacterium]